MHGRLKVRTSEEEKLRKKKEQLLKVRAYKAAMAKIQVKRQKEEYDSELLEITSIMLQRNPDISTLWNLRRECVLNLRTQLDQRVENDGAEEAKEGEVVSPKIEPVNKLYDVELNLTEQCLKVNPKSYCAWHHRCWTLEHSPQPNWNHEVQLCTKYLKLDERNFHTWDYRRYVVKKAGVAKEQELDFCTDKIKVNFSNYSSWHHRSLLLPHLYPYEGDDSLPKRPMSETKLQEELEMVVTAAFTDPNDSSAWFYQRWLLSCTRPELDVCAFRCDGQKAVLAFSKPIAADSFRVSVVQIHDKEDSASLPISNWEAVNGSNNAKVDTTWLTAWPVGTTFNEAVNCIEIDIPNVGVRRIQCKRLQDDDYYYFSAPNKAAAFGEAVLVELRSQLDSCNSLLEYEPDSKWTLLTSALLMHAIDRQQYHDEMIAFLNKLEHVDVLRKGYYRDLASKWILEKALNDWSTSENVPKQLNLKGHVQLTSLYYPQYFSIADEVHLPVALQEVAGIDSKLRTFGQLGL